VLEASADKTTILLNFWSLKKAFLPTVKWEAVGLMSQWLTDLLIWAVSFTHIRHAVQ